MDSTEKSLKEKQIEAAQHWVNIISQSRPNLKGQKVVAVDTTEHPFECIVRFNDWTTAKITGLDAKLILAGCVPIQM